MMDEPTLINNIDRLDRLHSLIRHDFRDLGIKLPKSKKVKKQTQRKSTSSSAQDGNVKKLFGEALSQVPSVYMEQYGFVPQFLVNTSEIVIQHAETEGIFRKSGSISRQKELRIAIEEGKSLDEANINDVTSLIKQFFRELPEPLILTMYHDAYLKCFQLSADKDPKESLLRLCLLLPLEHIGTLRFTMHMLYRVALRSDRNRMTYNNLALVVGPNLLGTASGGKVAQKMSSTEEKNLHMQTCIVEFFIKHWDQLGIVSAPLRQQLNMMAECFGTDDELDASDDNGLEDTKDVLRKKKRRRSGSLTGIVSSIAKGMAKLRRSTDGKSFNMSTNSTFRGETSVVSDASMMSQNQNVSQVEATPNIMRKRRASGDAVPFSSTKKQAILGKLPQGSALGSTPFTPAALKKDPKDPRLNATTPVMGTKTSRKKLNLFTSASGNKRMKSRQTATSGQAETSPPKREKDKNLLGKIGESSDKDLQGNSVISESVSERLPTVSKSVSPRTVSDSALNKTSEPEALLRPTSSSSSLQDNSECSIVVVDDDGDDPDNVFLPEDHGSSVRMPAPRSKSVDSPGTSHSKSSKVTGALGRDNKGKSPWRDGKVEKFDISGSGSLVKPKNAKGKESESRRSRREEFDRHHRKHQNKEEQVEETAIKNVQDKCGPDGSVENSSRAGLGRLPCSINDLDKSMASELDESLMETVLDPPHGFGDQTMLEEEMLEDPCGDQGAEADSDVQSEAGFSTISGGTVMRRTKSGNYTSHDSRTVSASSIGSSVSSQRSSMPPPQSVADMSVLEDPYVALRSDATKENSAAEGEYVVLQKMPPKSATGEPSVSEGSKGMKMLCENYGHSSEEDSSSGNVKCDLNSTLGSHQDDLDNMPDQTDVSKGRSLSAEDLQTRAQVSLPVRARSLYLSPCRKFNYKPHLEISRETHNILARAGYIPALPPTDKSKDLYVPVKSPQRSSHREEMKTALRSSFYERHSRLSTSLRSNKNRSIMDRSTTSRTSTSPRTSSISSGCEKMTLSGEGGINAAAGDACGVADDATKRSQMEPVVSELMQKVTEISASLRVCNQQVSQATAMEDETDNTNANCSAVSQNGDSKDTKVVTSNTSSKEQGATIAAVDSQVKIKRAEVVIPKHDSILNVQQAGIVAQSVRHFSKVQDTGLPEKATSGPAQRKGNPAVRIPTIFVKDEEKKRQYKKLSGLVRQRSQTGNFMNMPETPATPRASGGAADDIEDDDISYDSESDEGDVTVLEVKGLQENETTGGGSRPVGSDGSASVSSPSKMAGSSVALTPRKAEQCGPQVIKSPLLESTNTAPRTPGFNLNEALALCNPSEEVLHSLGKVQPSPSTPASLSSSRPQVKRLKDSSARRPDMAPP